MYVCSASCIYIYINVYRCVYACVCVSSVCVCVCLCVYTHLASIALDGLRHVPEQKVIRSIHALYPCPRFGPV